MMHTYEDFGDLCFNILDILFVTYNCDIQWTIIPLMYV